MIFESDDLDSLQPANDIEAAVLRIMTAVERHEWSSPLGPVQRWNELAAIIRAELSRVPAQQDSKRRCLIGSKCDNCTCAGEPQFNGAQQVEVPAVEPVTEEEVYTAQQQKKTVLSVAIEVCKKRELIGMDLMLVMSAAVELTEPSA